MRVKITHKGKDFHIDWDKSVPPTKEEAAKIAEDLISKTPFDPIEEIKNSPIGKAANWLFSSPEGVQSGSDRLKGTIDEGSGPLFFNWGQGNDVEGGREFAKNLVDFATPTRADIATAGVGLAAKPVLKGIQKAAPRVLSEFDKIVEAAKAVKRGGELGTEAGVFKFGKTGSPKPRWKNFELTFASDEDKAAYILAGKGESKAHQKILEQVQKEGLDIEELLERGMKIRQTIKKAEGGASGTTINVPSHGKGTRLGGEKLKWKDALDLLGPFQRSVQSMGEMSRPLRQAKIPTLLHPKSSGPAFKNMFKAAVDPDHVSRVMAEVDSRPFANIKEFRLDPDSGDFQDITRNLYRESGLRMSDLKEAFPSGLAEKIPGLRQVTKRSEAAYQAYGDTILPNEFDRIMAKHGFSLTNLPDNATLRQIGETVNTLAGSGGGGKFFEEAVPTAQKFLYSPRYQKSQVDLLNPWNYSGASKRFGKIGASELRGDVAKFGAGALGGIAGIDALSDDVDVTWNPLDSDFAKIKVGDTRFNPLGAVNPLLRTGARTAKNLGNLAFGDDFNEFIEPLVGEESANKKVDLGFTLQNFLRSKLAPGAATLAGDLAFGQGKNKETGETEIRNVVGEPLRDENYFGKNFETPYLGHMLGDNTPLYYQELGEIANSNNPELNWFAAPLGFFGADSSTYKKREPGPQKPRGKKNTQRRFPG